MNAQLHKSPSSAAFLLLLVMVSCTLSIFAQRGKMSVSVHFAVKADTCKMRVYDLHPKDENEAIKTVLLKMQYGNSEILNPEAAKELTEVGANVISVEVVYTDYRKQDVQNALNRKRLTELYFLTPGIFTQSHIQWKYIEQVGYATEDAAKRLFHGIVVKYMKVPVYTPPSPKSMLSEVTKSLPRDTAFFTLFEKQIKFKDELICVDLTGSMSPYYMQVFQWLYLKNSSKALSFSLFNDGDATPDDMKRMGNVGGIYLFKTNSIDTIVKHAYRCINAGYGGDAPENNIESATKGVSKFQDTKEIVMLVDNWADMRDYAMMADVKVPVKVIVCGTNYMGVKSAVNCQYLDLARRTGGSIHTIEEDLEDMGKKKEGDEITVGGMRYIIRGGRFVQK